MFETHTSVLVLVPLRLGLDGLQLSCVSALAASFRSAYHMGIIGGRPNASLYFVAAQGMSIRCL